MKKGGRPSKYHSEVKPRFPEIKEWLKTGATDKEIAENLGINKATFCEYKKKFPEFYELCKNGRRQPVQAIKAALFKRAIGFSYQESKKTIENGIVLREEIYTKSALPDPTSAMMLLRHWDQENEWTAEPALLKLKKEELELKKKHLESEDW